MKRRKLLGLLMGAAALGGCAVKGVKPSSPSPPCDEDPDWTWPPPIRKASHYQWITVQGYDQNGALVITKRKLYDEDGDLVNVTNIFHQRSL